MRRRVTLILPCANKQRTAIELRYCTGRSTTKAGKALQGPQVASNRRDRVVTPSRSPNLGGSIQPDPDREDGPAMGPPPVIPRPQQRNPPLWRPKPSPLWAAPMTKRSRPPPLRERRRPGPRQPRPARHKPLRSSLEELQAQLAEIAEENARVKDALKKAREDDLRKKRRLEEYEAEDEQQQIRAALRGREAQQADGGTGEVRSGRSVPPSSRRGRNSAARRSTGRSSGSLRRPAATIPEIIPPLIESFGFAGEIEIGEDGKIVGVKDAIKKLLDAKPGLASGQAKRGTPVTRYQPTSARRSRPRAKPQTRPPPARGSRPPGATTSSEPHPPRSRSAWVHAARLDRREPIGLPRDGNCCQDADTELVLGGTAAE
jgi:hypothetical protein